MNPKHRLRTGINKKRKRTTGTPLMEPRMNTWKNSLSSMVMCRRNLTRKKRKKKPIERATTEDTKSWNLIRSPRPRNPLTVMMMSHQEHVPRRHHPLPNVSNWNQKRYASGSIDHFFETELHPLGYGRRGRSGMGNCFGLYPRSSV